MTSVPLVSVFTVDNSNNVTGEKVPLPGVFQAPIRLDVVQFVYANLAKNRRQAHGVDPRQGHKHAAESWGTGRAVARIPRVSGSGTHRAGQAAFGNQCRKGRMFAPLKTWRRWHRKVNLKQRRHAAASAIAASGITPLVMARGHLVDQIPQLPLVIDDKLENIEKTKEAVAFLKKFGVYADVQKVVRNKSLRAGKGKLRNRRYRLRKGPLVIYSNTNAKLVHAFRNVPGVEVCNVHRLNLRQLAPGGQLGRLIVWTKGAFKALDTVFGSQRKQALEKKDYQLQRPLMTNPDLARIINSNEVQSVVKDARCNRPLHEVQKKNPHKNAKMMERLNPYHKEVKKISKQRQVEAQKRHEENKKAKRGVSKVLSKEQKVALRKRKKASRAFMTNVLKNLDVVASKDAKADDDFRALVRGQHHEEEEEAGQE